MASTWLSSAGCCTASLESSTGAPGVGAETAREPSGSALSGSLTGSSVGAAGSAVVRSITSSGSMTSTGAFGLALATLRGGGAFRTPELSDGGPASLEVPTRARVGGLPIGGGRIGAGAGAPRAGNSVVDAVSGPDGPAFAFGAGRFNSRSCRSVGGCSGGALTGGSVSRVTGL